MVETRFKLWLKIFLCWCILHKAESLFVDITHVTTAVAEGAVCLDGSPPAYHLDRGSGSGINSWLVQLEGGGWCNNVSSCLLRKKTRLGSSRLMGNNIAFSAIMSNERRYNPEFYNWNRVKIRYCDGSSFTGDVPTVDPATQLHFRGARVWLAVMKDLLAKGMKNAENAVLSGCSAGGLAAVIHCDGFKALFPMRARVKCLSDAGFFLNIKDISGAPHIQSYFSQVVSLHGSTRSLPPSCTSKMDPTMCFFAQNIAGQIKTPLFILSAAYDSWQMKNILAPRDADPRGEWKKCQLDIKNCLPNHLRVMQDFRLQFLRVVEGLGKSMSRGMFIDSCYTHCQTETQKTWFWPRSTIVNKMSIAEAVGSWFYDRHNFVGVDCPFPCNPTCENRVFDPKDLHPI